ncbi:YgaP family membrane protein [Rubeoparvulum massiliense]|uniref:YgaP family membrane protein n=1 Tax=Rubeoparvulum massiliense TaxID=1631346 RepID=UPI000975EFA0|nr:DUF2892 domain-containing protein [Rubeoparvulum massiliense]
MKKNVGTLDAFLRISFGLTGLAFGISRMSRHPYRSFPITLTMMSAMKVAEGITRFCPMLALFGVSSKEMDGPCKARKIPIRSSDYQMDEEMAVDEMANLVNEAIQETFLADDPVHHQE